MLVRVHIPGHWRGRLSRFETKWLPLLDTADGGVLVSW